MARRGVRGQSPAYRGDRWAARGSRRRLNGFSGPPGTYHTTWGVVDEYMELLAAVSEAEAVNYDAVDQAAVESRLESLWYLNE